MTRTARPPLLAARVSPSLKQQFEALACEHGLSASALLQRLVLSVLESNAHNLSVSPGLEAASQRLSLRLRPGEGAALSALSARRQLRPATYVAALIHSHLHGCAMLPIDEVAAVKVVASNLSGLGRELQQLPSKVQKSELWASDLQSTLQCAVDAFAETRAAVAEVVRANLRCWECGHV